MEHLTQIIRLLIKNLFLLVSLPLLSIGVLFFLTKNETRFYEVKSKFLFDFQDSKSTSLSGEMMNEFQIYMEFQNTLELIKSKKIGEVIRTKIAYDHITGEKEIFSYKWDAQLRPHVVKRLEGILEDRTNPYLKGTDVDIEINRFYAANELETGEIMDAVSAYRQNGSYFMEVGFKYSDPRIAFYIINLLNDSLIEEKEALSQKNINRQKSIIVELVRKAKQELDAKVKELEKLKIENNIINLGNHTEAIVDYQVKLEGQRANLISRLASARRAGEEIKKGIANESLVQSQHDRNKDLLDKKTAVHAARDLKLYHLKDEIDYGAILEQEHVIRQNYLDIASNLRDRGNAVTYDPDKINTDLTMQYINFSINSNRLEEELATLDDEIKRVQQYSAYFAPFESMISTLRDEIATAQSTYLLYLNKLNMTESMQAGAAESKLTLIEYPIFPLSPLPSKRIIIVAAGGVAVFVVCFGVIVILYLLNNSINDIHTFERFFKKEVKAVLPFTPVGTDPKMSGAIRKIEREEIKKIINTVGENKIIALNGLSTKDNVDDVVEHLKVYWDEEEVKVLDIEGDEKQIHKQVTNELGTYDRLLLKGQPLQFSYDGLSMAREAHCSFLIFNMGRIQSPADKRVMNEFDKRDTNFAGFILNSMHPDYLDSYVGQVPKRRSRVRILLKKLMNREFA